MPGERLVTNRLSHDAAFRSVILGRYSSGISRFLSIYMQMNESTCTEPKGLSYLSSNIRFTSKWRICPSQMQPYCYALVHTLPLKYLRITNPLCLWREGWMYLWSVASDRPIVHPFDDRWMIMGCCWVDTWRAKKWNVRILICFSAIFSVINVTWIALELNPELCTFSIEIILSYFTIYRVIKKELNMFQNELLGAS